MYELDWNKDFYRNLNTHEDILQCQETYLDYYSKNYPEMLCEDIDEDLEESDDESRPLGAVYIHPTAEVSPEALIGPNVSIGA